jgi:hypothetical protein
VRVGKEEDLMNKLDRDLPSITALDVWNRLRGGSDLLLVCADEEHDGPGLPGALTLGDLRRMDEDVGRDLVFFSRGPGDAAALHWADAYRRRGFVNVRIVEGGAEALRASMGCPY